MRWMIDFYDFYSNVLNCYLSIIIFSSTLLEFNVSFLAWYLYVLNIAACHRFWLFQLCWRVIWGYVYFFHDKLMIFGGNFNLMYQINIPLCNDIRSRIYVYDHWDILVLYHYGVFWCILWVNWWNTTKQVHKISWRPFSMMIMCECWRYQYILTVI